MGISADFITVPVSVPSAQGQSAYTCSKLAQTKMFEFLAAENPDVFVVSVHPGIVQTDMVNDLFAGQAVDPSILDDSKSLPPNHAPLNKQILQPPICMMLRM